MIGSKISLSQRPAIDGARLAAEVEVGGVRRDVVEQPARLGVLDVQAGERLQLALVVAELDDLGLDPHPVTVEVGDDVELVDVEAEVVEPLDPALDPPHLVEGELLLAGQLVPQRVVALLDQLGDLPDVEVGVEGVAGLQVEQLGEDVLAADPDVVLAHRRRQAVADLAGLGVDEVRREAAGRAPEQHVRQRHVAPVEAAQVQPDEQHDQRVDERGQVVGRQAVLEEAAVGQGEGEVLGEQGGRAAPRRRRRRGRSPRPAGRRPGSGMRWRSRSRRYSRNAMSATVSLTA